jgi:hypothetical protein
MEKFILARIAKLQTVDKIMDKMWKTLKGFLRASINVCATSYPQFFAHSLQQALQAIINFTTSSTTTTTAVKYNIFNIKTLEIFHFSGGYESNWCKPVK